MKYENGTASPISEPISADCYRPNCFISLEIKGNKLIVKAESKSDYYIVPNRPEVLHKVYLEKEIANNKFGGFGFQHTGTVAGGATLIKDMTITCH